MITEEERIVFKAMEEADSIVFFGHKNPDGDCVGSVMGMKHAIMELFPDKKVYGVGTHPSYLPSFIEEADQISDEVIENSLAVVVDVSDSYRVEDQRFLKAKKIVCVDHHIKSSEVDFPVYRVEDAPSATWVLSKCLLDFYGKIPSSAAPYLFVGLITDTGRFQFDSEPETLEIAEKLILAGTDYKSIYRDLYKQKSVDLRFRSFVYSHFVFDGLVTYVEIHKENYLPLGMTENDAGSKVNLISQLDNHPIWVSFCEQNDGQIRVEFRSDGSYDVQQVAVKFGGGGHLCASGCRLDSFDKVKEVVAACNQAKKIK